MELKFVQQTWYHPARKVKVYILKWQKQRP